MEEIERRVIHETLRHTKGDKTLAARLLGIATRTIYRKLERDGRRRRRRARAEPRGRPGRPVDVTARHGRPPAGALTNCPSRRRAARPARRARAYPE